MRNKQANQNRLAGQRKKVMKKAVGKVVRVAGDELTVIHALKIGVS
jgi:hypothetical protein